MLTMCKKLSARTLEPPHTPVWKRGGRRLAALALSLAMTPAALCPAFAASFSDVPEKHWAYTSVEETAAKGWVNGVGDGTFAPDREVSTSEFVAMVSRAFYAATLQATTDNLDSSGEWWLPAMETAYLKGILVGTQCLTARDSGEYAWDGTVTAPMTRYDMAQVVFNILSGQNRLPKDVDTSGSGIPDWNSIPEGYRAAVAACYAGGLLTGTDSSGTFHGDAVMTRAQAAVVMDRLA